MKGQTIVSSQTSAANVNMQLCGEVKLEEKVQNKQKSREVKHVYFGWVGVSKSTSRKVEAVALFNLVNMIAR